MDYKDRFYDGKPVVFHKTPKAPPPSSSRSTTSKKLDDPDAAPAKTVSFDLRTQIQKARSAKNLTRKQLAQKLNIKEAVIASYENGSAIPDANILNKLNRALGVKLMRK